jgi:hypothetical protein
MMPFSIQKLCKQRVRMWLAPKIRPEGAAPKGQESLAQGLRWVSRNKRFALKGRYLNRPRPCWGPIRRAIACSGHSTRFLTLPVLRIFAHLSRLVCHEQATARRMDRGSFAGGRWKKDEWRKQTTGVSLVAPEKRPRTTTRTRTIGAGC